jgi:hypothetical protein
VGPNEGLPRGRALALWGRRHAVAQNISYGLAGDFKFQIGQRPTIRSWRHQLLNCPVDPGSSWASMLRAIEFARDDAECLAAQSTTNRAELRSLGARSLGRPLNWALRIWFSAARYSFRSSRSCQGPGDAGQNKCPLPELPYLAASSRWAPLIAPKNLTDNARRETTPIEITATFLQF